MVPVLKQQNFTFALEKHDAQIFVAGCIVDYKPEHHWYYNTQLPSFFPFWMHKINKKFSLVHLNETNSLLFSNVTNNEKKKLNNKEFMH